MEISPFRVADFGVITSSAILDMGMGLTLWKGRSLMEGLILGFLFGPFGGLAIALIPTARLDETDSAFPEIGGSRPTEVEKRALRKAMDAGVQTSSVFGVG